MTADSRAEQKPVLAALPRITGQLNRIFTILLLGGLAVWLLVNFIKAPDQFLSVTLVGITQGAIYALVALGYTLVYGIIELINFAHGDVFMWGTMITVTVAGTHLGLDGSQSGAVTAGGLLLTLFVAMVFCGALNTGIEFVAYRRLRNAPRLAPLISAIGVSFILSGVASAQFYGFNYTGVGDIMPTHVLFDLGGVPYRLKSLLVVLITIPVLLSLVWWVRNTRQGKAMRAVAQDTEASRMMGIDVNRTISITFAVAGALAGAAGVLYVTYYTQTRFDLGFQLGLFAFTAAVLGGIGNLTGAALGALCIGLITAYNDGLSWHAPGSDWTQSIVFTILILILVFRPEGLLGEPEADRA